MAGNNNPFYVSPPDVLGALMLGDKSFNEAQQRGGRQAAMNALQTGGDLKGALASLIGAGDVAGANAIANFANQQADQQFRQQSLDLQGRQISQTGEYQKGELANSAEARKLARDQFEQGKIQLIPDIWGGPPTAVSLGHSGVQQIPVQPANSVNLTGPGKQVTGIEYGPVQTAGGPAPQPNAASPLAAAPVTQRLDAATLMKKYGGSPGDGRNWDYLATLPPQAQEKVIGVVNHNVNPVQAYSTRIMPGGVGISPRDAVVTAASTFDTGYNMQDYPLVQQTRKNFEAGGPQGNLVRSLNVVTDHAATLKELAAALQNGNIPLFNSIAAQFSKQTGQPAPGNLTAAAQIVGTELVKALGVAQAGTAEERAKLGTEVSTASSPAQVAGVIDNVVRPLLAGQLRGLRQQYVSGTKQPESKFNSMLFPATVKFLDSTPAASTPGAASSSTAQSGAIVIQNGNRFQLNADGTSTFLGAAQ